MKFQVILADPAWVYDDRALAGERGAGCKYTLMDDDALARLPVGELADDNAVLFLWSTMPKLQEALNTGRAWGFTYKTCAFTWVKTTPAFGDLIAWLQRPEKISERPSLAGIIKTIKTLWFIGMGHWTRSNTELCLLFVRGKPLRVDAGVNQIIAAPRLTHSAKPAEVRERITRLMGEETSKIELFAREDTPGWIALGNEIDGRDLMETVPEWAKL